ncbi:MAG: TonB-dependent receptor [Acidobacteriota bacterium]
MSAHRVRAVRRLLAVSCLSLVSAGVFAQATGTTTGDLRGRVTDESGAVLPGVLVTAVSREAALARSDTTGSDGKFAIRLLPLAPYRVSAALDGFEPLELESVRVLLGSSVNLELRLKVATVTESVTVGAREALIDPTSTDVSQTIDETMIRNLPINQRDFLDFALTTPGVEADRGPQTGAASTSGLSINGQSPRQNNMLVDGLDNNDQAVGSVRSTFSQDAVEEYQVIRSSFAAEYGRATGGIVNIVTRSGSNDLHGSAFYFFRDDSLAADNALAGTKTPFEQHQFGATVGGPLLRERLFAFGAVERLSVSDANFVAITDPEVLSAIRAAGFMVQSGVVPFDRDRTAAIVKLDWAPRPAHRLSLRGTYAEEKDENQQAWGGLVARSAGGVRRIEDSALAAAGISVLSESLSNEARVLYASRRHRLESLDPTGGVSVAILGVASFGADPTLPQPRDARIFQAFDAVSFFRGNSSYKVGVDYLRNEIEGRLPLYFGGQYLFSGDLGPSSLDAFRLGRPLVFLQGFGDPRLEDSSTEVAAFAQGEWGVGEHVLLRAGFRYDYEDPIAPFPKDSNNWSPRLSFSWAGGNRWRIHGGLGRFYGVVPIAPASLIAIENGDRARIVLRTIEDEPSSAFFWSLPDRRFPSEPEADAIPFTVYRLGGFESAYSDQATVGLEKELSRTLLFHLDYLHARGRKVLIEHNVNPFDPVLGRRLDRLHGDVFAYDSVGNTWYEALTAGLRTGLGRPLELAAHYTFADAEDDHIDWSKNQPQDPLKIGAERGRTVHVPRHRVVLSAVWTAPGRAGEWWRRDWTAAVIADYASGFPYNELAGFDRNGNRDAFSDRPEGVRRNSRTLPDFFNVDLRVARRFLVGRAAVEAIVEVFNLLDRENILEVNNVRYQNAGLEPNPSFGEPTRVADPRRVQLGVRLTF